MRPRYSAGWRAWPEVAQPRWQRHSVWRALGDYLVVTGKLTIDVGRGRRVRALGRFGVEVAAPAAIVFDVIAAPYPGRTPRAISGKLKVLDRESDMVLAEHYTPVQASGVGTVDAALFVPELAQAAGNGG